MSIAENYGGLYQNLKQLRDTDGKAENNFSKRSALIMFTSKTAMI